MNTTLLAVLLSTASLSGAAPIHTSLVDELRPVATSDPPRRVARHLELAMRAGSEGRIATAVDHIRFGLATPVSSRGVSYDKARLETWAISWREQVVLASLAAGQVRDARELLDRLSEPLDSSYAEDRADELHRRVVLAERALADADNGRVAPLRAKMLRRIEKSEVAFSRAERDLQRAQSNSRRTVYSARRAERALRRLVAIEGDVEEWLRTPELDPRTTQDLIALRIRAEEGALRAILRIANARTTQGSFREALEWVDRAVTRAPGNADARELRRTIQLASAASSPWIGWGPIMPLGQGGAR